MGWSTCDLTRALAVIKLWESDKGDLDYDGFARRVAGGRDYDVGDLQTLLRNNEQPVLDAVIEHVTENRRWLGQRTALETRITQDAKRTLKEEVAT
ncbi:hypothetical protein [Propylenella binzhouense]|uniref:Uncharacterized protein n=1 Tax=Propylenella binzhouense TaxID=2555902 RepID=A0A964T0N5_9HYPH|nr:hypothetical protein [Propylenella binzhouense]MYZ46213.1 hypothetical protein [Propylenella binzhouense]